MKFVRNVLLLITAAAMASSVLAQISRPTPASSNTTARAVDNMVRPVVPTNDQISQIAYDTIAINRATLIPIQSGSHCGQVSFSADNFYPSSYFTSSPCNGATLGVYNQFGGSAYGSGAFSFGSTYTAYNQILCPAGYSGVITGQGSTPGGCSGDSSCNNQGSTLVFYTCMHG